MWLGMGVIGSTFVLVDRTQEPFQRSHEGDTQVTRRLVRPTV